MLEATPRGAPAHLWRTRRHLVYLSGGAAARRPRRSRDRQGLEAPRLVLRHGRERADRPRPAPAGVRARGAALARAGDPPLHRRRRLARRPRAPLGRARRAGVRRRRLHKPRARHAPGRLVQPAFRSRARQGSLPLLRRPGRAARARRRGRVAAVAALVGARCSRGSRGDRVRIGSARPVREAQRRLAGRDPEQRAARAGDDGAVGTRAPRPRRPRRAAGAPAREGFRTLARRRRLGRRASRRSRSRSRPSTRSTASSRSTARTACR